MLLSGIVTIIVLACSGLYVEKLVKHSVQEAEADSPDSYFSQDVPELGIQPQIVTFFCIFDISDRK